MSHSLCKALALLALVWGVASLCGCATYHSQEYASLVSSKNRPDGLTLEINLVPKRSRFHIPYFLLRTRSGPPYVLDLIARSYVDQSGIVEIEKLLLNAPGGQVYDILRGASVSLVLDPVPLAGRTPRGSSKVVLARGDWRSSKLPLTFLPQGECTVVVHYKAGGQAYVTQSKFKAKEDQYRDFILTAYGNI